MDLTEFIVWNIEGLRHRVAKIQGNQLRVFDKKLTFEEKKNWKMRKFPFKEAVQNICKNVESRLPSNSDSINLWYLILSMTLSLEPDSVNLWI